jgi:predicted DNA-binding transcriptional regulator AlpA
VIKINAYEKIEKLSDKDLKLITGVSRETFYKMLEV